MPPVFSHKLGDFIKTQIEKAKELGIYECNDLFSGAGGLTRATCDSGFNIVLSNEVNPVFAKTHHYNFPSIPMVTDDINNLTIEVINEYVKGQEIDLVEGGPPCQGFSIFEREDLLTQVMILNKIQEFFGISIIRK